jgi:hypothetical protein
MLYAYRHVQMTQPSGVGYGIGMAFTLFIMQEVASLVSSFSITTMSSFLTHPRSGSKPLCHKYDSPYFIPFTNPDIFFSHDGLRGHHSHSSKWSCA